MENIKSYFIAEWNLSQFSNDFTVDFKKSCKGSCIILTMKSYDKDHVLVKTNKLRLCPNQGFMIDNGLKGKYDKNDLEKWYKFIKNNYYPIRDEIRNRIKNKIDELNELFNSVPYNCS